jgi:hypothetical protein
MPLVIRPDPDRIPLAIPYTLNEHRFWIFHTRNPHVLEEAKTLAYAYKAEGHKLLAINFIMELVRWVLKTPAYGDAPFRIKNDHRPFYSRLIMREEPELAGFFRIRRLRNPAMMFNTDWSPRYRGNGKDKPKP